MVLAQTEQNHEVQKARGSKANIPPPGRRRRRTAGVGITQPCGPTKRRRSPVDMEGSRRSVWLWSCGERNAERGCFPTYPQRKRKDPSAQGLRVGVPLNVCVEKDCALHCIEWPENRPCRSAPSSSHCGGSASGTWSRTSKRAS